MLRPSSPDLKVYLHRKPIDLRAGRNGLAAIAREVMQQDPFGKTCFLFTNKRYKGSASLPAMSGGPSATSS